MAIYLARQPLSIFTSLENGKKSSNLQIGIQGGKQRASFAKQLMYVSHSSETLWEPLHTICPLLKMAIFTVITMAYYLTFSQGAGFKAAREQAKCRKDSAGLGPSTAILFVSCRTRRKYSESLGRRSCSSSPLSNYFPLISGYLVYCNFVYCYTARKI